VGGRRSNVLQHTVEVHAHDILGAGDPVDFKLSESNGALNEHCCIESGFQRLAVRECEELVSLNLKGYAADSCAVSRHAATKLSPEDFHSAMQSTENLVLIDTRNIYEHSIGYMCVVRCF
jgi:predicted sulfurtransferase